MTTDAPDGPYDRSAWSHRNEAREPIPSADPSSLARAMSQLRHLLPRPGPTAHALIFTATFIARWSDTVPIHVPCSGIASRGVRTTATRKTSGFRGATFFHAASDTGG